MKIRILFYAALILMFIQSGCKPVMNVTRVSGTKAPSNKEGYYYALPRNYIKIDVVVNKTEQLKGPYAEFAEKYLGLTNVIKTNSTSYEINEMKLSTYTEPDPQQFYFVEMNKCSLKKSKAFEMALTEAGLMVGSDFENTNAVAENNSVSLVNDETVFPDIFKYYADFNLFEKVDTIIEKVNVDSVTVEKMTFKRSVVEKTPEQKAKNAADFIIKVKENRFNLISGFQEVNYDKETFKNMNEELEKMESEYRKLFTGISVTKKITYSFVYLPKAEKQNDSIGLFRFSKLKGVLDTTNGFGDVVNLKICKVANTDSLKSYVNRKAAISSKNHGLYYRISDYANITISDAKNESVNAKFLIPQFGVVTSIPANLSKTRYYETGALKQVGGK